MIKNPSQKQQAIFDAWLNEDKNLVVKAVAGSGKTTTLLSLVELCKYTVLFLAFNKSIQEEIQAKLDSKGLSQGKAMTMHSMGLSALRSSYSKVYINAKKNYDLLKIVEKKNQEFYEYFPWKNRLTLNTTLMDMNDAARMFLDDTYEEVLKNLLVMGKVVYEIEELKDLWKDMVEARLQSYQGDRITIDFNDMIYLPVLKKLRIPYEPTYLFIDEAQDLNLCQHALINLLLSQGTIEKWVAVGDSNQSIYGFSGAYSNSFDMFINRENVIQLPLDINYRSKKKIIEQANQVYDVMEAYSVEDGIVDYIEDTSQIKEDSMVICRNSSPLISLYFDLISQGKPCHIKGKDIMNNLFNFLKPYMDEEIPTAIKQMNQKEEKLLKDKSDLARLNLFIHQDNYQNFMILAANLLSSWDRVPVKKLTYKVREIFSDDNTGITLCTIHKAKGLENDIVYILNENLIPSRFAITDDQLVQERNLKYVGRSRAKNELYYLTVELEEQEV